MPGHDPYFAALNKLLRKSGAGVPRLLIDLDRVDRNLDRLIALQQPESIRIVVKSLPCPELLAYVLRSIGHEKLMVFHLPFLLQVVERFPAADLLMGKPMPIAAVESFYDTKSDFGADRRLQWLVDTDARLRQLAEFARARGRRLSVNIELDVGLHRGGLAKNSQLTTMLDTAREFRRHVRLGGFMGYDAHVPKAPWPRSVSKAAKRSKQRYTEFLEHAWLHYSDLEEEPWCVNGAGTPTVAMHHEESPLNDVSVGSLLVKPSNFDLPTLEDFEPAAWIASPVLKRSRGVQIPYLERLPARGRDTLFIYGGRWMALPYSPERLTENPTYGMSSNQQMLNLPAATALSVDDYVFLRPTQSESVLLQFGDLAIVRGSGLLHSWPTLQNAGFPMR